MDAARDVVVVWQSAGQDGDSPTDTNIYGQRYDANGQPQGGAFHVNAYLLGVQANPTVAMDSQGDFVVVWQSRNQVSGSGYDIFATRYDATGHALDVPGQPAGTKEFRVNTTSANDQADPAVAMDAEGDFVVTWDSVGQDNDAGGSGTSTNIYAQRYNAAGVAQGREFRVNTFQRGNQNTPAVAMDASGNFVVTYQGGGNEENADSSTGVFARRYNAAGTAQEADDFQVNTTVQLNQQNPAIAMLPGTGFVIVWNSAGQEADAMSNTNVYAQRFDTAANKLGGEFRVNTYQASNQRNAAVAADSSGNFTVTWRSFGETGTSTDDIYGQQFTALGETVGDEFLVNTYPVGTQSASAIAMGPEGDFTVVWDSSGEDSSGYGVYAQRYQGPNVPVALADGYTVPINQSLVIDAAKGALVNDSDPKQLLLTSALVTGPSHGSLTFNTDGSFTYVPTANFAGVDQFVYAADNGTRASAWTIVTLVVIDETSLNTVSSRLFMEAMINASSAPAKVTGLLAQMNADGSFAGFDYSGTTDTSADDYVTHANNLATLARAYQYNNASNTWYQNSRLLEKLVTSFTYLAITAAGDATVPNWYDTEIAMPNALWSGMVLLQTQLGAILRTALLTKYFDSSARPVWNAAETGGENDGSNLTLRATAAVAEGALRDDPGYFTTRLSEVVRLVAADVAGGDPLHEGLQADYSEHQHNFVTPGAAEFYSGSYGIDYAQSLAKLLPWLDGTPYAFSATTRTQVVGYVLDGEQWLMRGRTFEATSTGRAITRPGQVIASDASALLDAAHRLEGLGLRTTELQSFADRLATGVTASNYLSGNRAFWTSDFMVQQRQGYMASVRMLSNRTLRPETLNGEGLQNYYLGDGVTTLYLDGTEYGSVKGSEIFPVWNWQRLSGTTVEQTTTPPTSAVWTSHPDATTLAQYVGSTSFVGSSSDGTYGLAAMDYARGAVNVTANKAYFFFDDEFVALGADINDSNTANDVDTTLSQVLLKGNVTVADAAGTQLSFGNGTTMSLVNPRWAAHNGVGYVFLGNNGNVVVQAQTQFAPTGNWSGINTNYASTTAVAQPVFTAYVNEGVHPQNASYAYAVVPNVTTSKLDNYYNNLPITVLANTAALQAVRHNVLGITEAAFYAAGTLTLPDGITVTTDNPCLVLIRELTGGEIELAVSDPTQALAQVQLTLNRHLAGANTTWFADTNTSQVLFPLPTGVNAGQSVVLQLSVLDMPPFSIIYNPPSTPIVSEGAPNQVSEGAANGTPVGIMTASTDPTHPVVTYRLTDNVSGRFTINPITSVVTLVKGSLLNDETASSHTVTVQAGDGQLTSSAMFTLNMLQDVGLVHQGQCMPFGLETGNDLSGVHAGLDDLQGDLALHRLGLLGHKDGPHAALADLLQQLVRADHHAVPLRQWLIGRNGQAASRGLQEATSPKVILDELLDVSLQVRIATTRLGNEFVPFHSGVNLHCCGEDQLDLVR
jgi:hypothetical protein